jgi:hypothetical protein
MEAERYLAKEAPAEEPPAPGKPVKTPAKN